MNANLLGREARRAARFFLILASGVVVFAVLLAAVFPEVKGQYENAIKSVPAFLRPLVQARIGLNTFENFVASAHTHPVILGLFAAWAIGQGSAAVAGEIEAGTIGWMLAYPIGRVRFLLTKAWVLLGGALALALLLDLAFWGMAHALRLPGPPLATYGWVALNGALLYGAVGMITLLASAGSSARSRPALVGGALFLGSFLLNFLAPLWAPLRPFRWLSLFAYDDPRAILLSQALPWRDAAALAAILVAALAGAVALFARRDLSI